MIGKERLIFNEDSIQLFVGNSSQTHYVMHRAETSLMHSLSDLATTNGGNILEIGFGLGICSDRIQKNPNVKSHTIIEVHPEIFEKALKWAEDKPNVDVLLGDWIDVIPTIRDIKFAGVLHDTFCDPNIEKLIDLVNPICENGCVIAFFYNPKGKDLQVLKHSFTNEEVKALPYKLPLDKETNSYDIKYRIVN